MSSSALSSGCRTFLFRSRLPQTNISSPYADPTRTEVKIQDDVFVVVKGPVKNTDPHLSNPSNGSLTFIKSISWIAQLGTITKKFSFWR
ncbi:Uncharacterized protein BM_BM479 [Brugia malayi]|uniref:Bm479 n=1 Tax=Brugia malayi TaxID=6279 RepID=A0A0J9XVR1_BRUMA|nr:Uncharacterized protein BM_BM479 [Brugia malayi]CDP96209.1 Bm479 [Brugia malayi]VIO98518.1 Uncharacterized protein BM_BM479 [Brugia malayi]